MSTTKNTVKHRVDMTLVEVSDLPRMNGWRALIQDKDGDQVIVNTANITKDGPGSTVLCHPSTLEKVSGTPINPPMIPGERYWSLSQGEAFDGDEYVEHDTMEAKPGLADLAPFVKLGAWNAPFHRRVLVRHLNESEGADFGTNDIHSTSPSKVKSGDVLIIADKATRAGFVEYFCGTVYTTDGKLALEPMFSLRHLNGEGARTTFNRAIDASHSFWETALDPIGHHREWFVVEPQVYATPGGNDPTDHMVNIPKAQALNHERDINALTDRLHDIAEDAEWCEQFDKVMDAVGLERRKEPESDWTITAEAEGVWVDDSPSSGLDQFLAGEEGDEVVAMTTSKAEYTGTVEFKFSITARKSDLDEILGEERLRQELTVEFDEITEIRVIDKEPADD